MGSVLKMVALPVLLACLLTIIGLPLSLSQQGLVRRRVVTQVSYNSEPRRRGVRVRKKRPRVVVVQQRNRLDALPAVYPTQFGGRDSLSGLPPPVLHPAVVQPGLSSTAFQPRTAYLPAAGPAGAVYQNPGYRPRLGSSGRRSGVPLPKCSYINTDFPGDDLYLDGATSAGLNAGSARACKARCKLEELCNFWTYREGDNRDTLTRDCFLKEGTPGLPVPREAVPRLGFVSGTQDNNCVCIKSEDEDDEVCPIKEPRGLVYPWRSTDEEENDLERGLPPLGWTRGVYGGLDPRLGPVLGGGTLGTGDPDNVLQDTVRALQDQLNILTRRLGGRTNLRDL